MSDSTAAAPVTSTEKPVSKADAPAPSVDKGKGKATATEGAAMEEDDEGEDDDEEDEDEDAEEEDDDEMEDAVEIDTSQILPPGTRRSTRAKVDYSSAEAMAKAGVKPQEEEHEEAEDSFTMKED